MTQQSIEEIRRRNVMEVGSLMLIGWKSADILLAGYAIGAILEARAQGKSQPPEAPDPPLPDHVIEGEDGYVRVDK